MVQSNPTYINQQQQFISQAMNSSTAMWTFVVSHYPLFGTATNYGNDAGAFPGQFNGWSMVSWLSLTLLLYVVFQDRLPLATKMSFRDLTLWHGLSTSLQQQLASPEGWKAYAAKQ